MPNPRVLIVDDEPDIRELLAHHARRAWRLDVEGRGATSPPRRSSLGAERFDLVPHRHAACPTATGSTCVEWIQTHRSRVPVAVITAHGNVESAVRALKLGAFDFVSKPLDLAGAAQAGEPARSAAAASRSTRPVATARRGCSGSRKPMQQLREMIAQGGAQPGAGAHLRRIRHRQGARRAAHPRIRPAPRRTVRAGELRRDPDGADGKRAVRSQARQLHGRRRRQEGPRSRAPRAARCSSTKSRTCRCTCR